MGDWGTIAGGFFGGAAGAEIGRSVFNEGNQQTPASSSYPISDDSAAAIAQSNDQLKIAQSQDATMRLGILKSSQDAQFQSLAWLTDRLDSNDTKMQIAVENAKLAFAQESDHHVEHMQQLKLDARQLEIDAADRLVS